MKLSRSPLWLFAAVLVVGGTITLTSFAQPAAGPSSHAVGVRVEALDLAGNHPHTITTIHLTNTSISTPVVVRSLVVLGPGGRNDVIGNHLAIAGTAIAPLKTVSVPVTSIPGVFSQTTILGYGIRNAIVAWSGEAEDLDVHAVIERFPTGSIDERVHVLEPSYALTN
jgi:hypothetical protein